VRRVLVLGTSGSGKTTLSRRLAAHLDAPCVELDALFHQPGWTQLPEPEFRAEVMRRVAGECWVVDGNYSAVRDLVAARADTVVWLDLPRHVVMWQVTRRTLWRAWTGDELWNGNRERPRNLLAWDPERSIIRWAWTSHARVRARTLAAFEGGYRGRDLVRLRSRREVAAFLAGL
jgi:adenylate kinase family enzyme